MSAYIAPVLLTVVVGLIASVMLALAAKFFAVPVDEKAVKIREALPGANCGACGFVGCDDYAAALAKDPTIAPNLCVPGGAGAAAAVAAVLGVDAGSSEPMVAEVHCSGLNDQTSPEMDYQGLKTCSAVKSFFGGPGKCKFGCIGFGDCTRACKFDAIEVCNGVAKVNRDLCVGCGACSKACPQHIIEIVPKKMRVHVECSSCDAGKLMKDICKVGCIGCKICEKNCKFDAIHVVNNHAVIDYDKCKNCGLCAKNCPKKIIHVIPRTPAPGAKPAAPAAKPAEAQAAPAPAEKPAEAPAQAAPAPAPAPQAAEAPAKEA